MAISRRFVPTAKRNTLLCQYLKPKLNPPPTPLKSAT
ncbi:hypothetical protein L4D04_23185 [Photobacterium angustum]